MLTLLVLYAFSNCEIGSYFNTVTLSLFDSCISKMSYKPSKVCHVDICYEFENVWTNSAVQ